MTSLLGAGIAEVSILDDAPGAAPKLDDVMKVFRGAYGQQSFARAEASRVALVLQGEYAFHGYGNARVDYEVVAATPRAVSLRYKVVRGQRWKLANVVFEGAAKVPVSELMAASTLELGAPYSALFGERAALLLQALLFDHGLLSSTVVAEPLTVDGQGNVELRFVVSERVEYKVRSVVFAEQSASTAKELLSIVKTRAPMVFNRTKMQADLEAVQAFFARRSRAVKATPRLALDPQRETVDVVIEIKDAVRP
jgi:outer membrane protein assembly factor BamA